MDKRERTLRSFFVKGKLNSWPVKQGKQLIVLQELARDFEQDVAYPESQVNEIISNRYQDYCLIRRLFVDLGFMRRENAIYRLNPQHRWPTFGQRFMQIADQLKKEYAGKPGVLALGCLGSHNQGRLWQHSDLDVLMLADLPRPQAAYQQVDGIPVHWQLLTPGLLQELEHAGLPLLQALASTKVWHDPEGILQQAIGQAQELLPARLPLFHCAEIAYTINQLHLAEKHYSLGDEHDARLALANALQSLSRTQGQAASRRQLSMGTPAALLFAELQENDIPTILDRAWEQARAQLPQLAQPLLQILRRIGPVSYPEMEQNSDLRAHNLSERLIAELVAAGAVTKTKMPHTVVSWEYKYSLGALVTDSPLNSPSR